jgi:hypothetical protein
MCVDNHDLFKFKSRFVQVHLYRGLVQANKCELTENPKSNFVCRSASVKPSQIVILML